MPTTSKSLVAWILSSVDFAFPENKKSQPFFNFLFTLFNFPLSCRVRLYELEQVTEQRNNIRRQYEDLRRQRLEAFMAGFGVISLKLKEMYQMITLGTFTCSRCLLGCDVCFFVFTLKCGSVVYYYLCRPSHEILEFILSVFYICFHRWRCRAGVVGFPGSLL